MITGKKSLFFVVAAFSLIDAQTAGAETIKMKCDMHLMHSFGWDATPQFRFFKFESRWFGKGRAYVRKGGDWVELCGELELKPDETKKTQETNGDTFEKSCIYGDKSIRYATVSRDELGQYYYYPQEMLLDFETKKFRETATFHDRHKAGRCVTYE